MSDRMNVVAAAGTPGGDSLAVTLPGLLLHKFVKNDSWRGALTTDVTGDNLPRHGSPWIYAKEVLVSPGDRRVGATPFQIAAGVSERGYFLFPISDDA